MNREYHHWYRPSLERDMELLVFGHAGARVLVFPTFMGPFFQWEDTGMIAALGEQLDQGKLQLFCVDSVDAESWYAKGKPPAERAWRQVQNDQYLLKEVPPFTRLHNSNPFLTTIGTSFGAYHAANFPFLQPHFVDPAIALIVRYAS